jgi:hypothetical protein
MASQALAAVPSEAEIDLRSVDYHKLVEKVDVARVELQKAMEPLVASKAELIELVRAYGGPHKEKSKILHGILWEIMGTFGQSIVQDNQAVEKLRLALQKNGQTRLLKKLFKQDIRWTFGSDAAAVIKEIKLTPRLKGMVLDCFVPADRTPTLDVRKKK